MKYIERKSGKIEPVFETGNNDIERKYAFLKSLPDFIRTLSVNNMTYFTTFTFGNSHQELHYDVYRQHFRFFYRKLVQMVCNRSTNYIKPTLLLIPENSYQCVSDYMHSCIHFHGFMFIHQKNHHKFAKNGVDYHSLIDNKVVLTEKLLNPYPNQIKFDANKKMLHVDSVDVKNVYDIRAMNINNSQSEFASFYSNKNFLKSSFTYDDVMIYSRNHDTQTHK